MGSEPQRQRVMKISYLAALAVVISYVLTPADMSHRAVGMTPPPDNGEYLELWKGQHQAEVAIAWNPWVFLIPHVKGMQPWFILDKKVPDAGRRGIGKTGIRVWVDEPGMCHGSKAGCRRSWKVSRSWSKRTRILDCCECALAKRSGSETRGCAGGDGFRASSVVYTKIKEQLGASWGREQTMRRRYCALIGSGTRLIGVATARRWGISLRMTSLV